VSDEPIINTDGLITVGEFDLRVMRAAHVDNDFTNVRIAGAVQAFTETGVFLQELLERVGPYDDDRTIRLLLTWVGDKIREVQVPQGDPDGNATH
jgi:hypothetical protein